MNLSSFHNAACRAASKPGTPGRAGFTMIEIAICLAIIGIALVAIIGVLPLGMRTQRDNREETIINQDASLLLEAIRNGSIGQQDLTNYVLGITNYCVFYPRNPSISTGIPYPYGAAGFTNAAQIIGLLSTPQYVWTDFKPLANIYYGGYSNHIVATIRSMSGYAIEKPPQNNDILREDTLTYRVLCENNSLAVDTNAEVNPKGIESQMNGDLHELRLRYLYPTLPSGSNGPGVLVFRTLVAGRIGMVSNNIVVGPNKNYFYYYYRSQNFDTNKLVLNLP